MGQIIDLTGKKFGKLTVIKISSNREKNGSLRWICKCECGNVKEIRGSHLKSGLTTSCGCKTKIFRDKNTKNIPLYATRATMIARCYNPHNQKYKRYGARGITVCEEWRKSFLSFYTWAHENGYRKGLTLDRINNDGNYEPSNCRWATPKQQANNASFNRIIEYNGEKHNLCEWSAITGVKRETIAHRLNKGWETGKALFKKPKRHIG